MQEECAIESILDHRLISSSSGFQRYELLISWLNPAIKASWETFEQINRDVPDLVKEYFNSCTGSSSHNITYE